MQSAGSSPFQAGDNPLLHELRKLAWIEDAVVARLEEAPRVVVYVLPRPGMTPRISEAILLAKQAGELAPLIVFIDSIIAGSESQAGPCTLPRPDLSRLDMGGVEAIPPCEGLESQIAQVWMDVLGEDRIGRFDNFRNAEGYSLMAAQVASRLASLLGREVALRDVHEAHTVWQLAARLQASEPTADRSPPPRMTAGDWPRAETDLMELSVFQQRIWSADRISMDASYHIAVGWRIRGSLDVGALQHAWCELQRRHEALRVRLLLRDARVMQRVEPCLDSAGLSVLQFTDMAGRDGDAGAPDEAREPFDLEHEPPLRGRLVRLAPDDHLLRVIVHHVVADGWTMGLLSRDLAGIYGAALRKTPVPPVQAMSLQDLVADENRRAAARPDSEAFWATRLACPAPRLALPFDRPEGDQADSHGDSVAFEIPQGLALGLKRYAAGQRCTVFSVLASVLQAFLFRLTGERCIRIGYPVARRYGLARERTAGCLINTLMLEAAVAPGDTVDQLVQRAQEALLQSSEHEDVLLERLAGHADAHPPFEVLLNFNEFDQPELALHELAVDSLPRRSLGSPYALAWIVSPFGAVLRGRLEYSADRFERATVERLAAHWLTLLQSAVTCPGRSIQDLVWMQPEQVLEELSAGEQPASVTDTPELVHRRFEMQARARPDEIAVRCDRAVLTYAELDRHANHLAHRLLEGRLAYEAPVAVCVSRGVWQAICLLAILKAGGTYLPVDPCAPDARIQRMLADARVKDVLADQTHSARFGIGTWRLLVVDRPDRTPSADYCQSPSTEVLPAHAAYCIYTSGSTGGPKGVLVSHEALAHHVSAAARTYSMSASDKVLQFASCAFDTSLEQMLAAWHSGASVIVRGDVLWSDHELVEWIRANEVTVADIPASYGNLLRFHLTSECADSLGLRLLIVGGEPVLPSPATGRPLAALCLNAYGPTEATITCTSGRLDDTFQCRGPYVSIGRPLPGTRISILDDRLRTVPRGVAGEICIAGRRLARGYLGRPDLTAERFVPDPYGAPGDRMYRSGDRGRLLPDGRIEFLGRTDQQVKIRGVRIELGEVEALLMAHRLVRDACVLVVDGPGDAHLVACLVLQSGDSSLDEVRRFAQLQLPASMQPARWLVRDSLPVTLQGKVNRAALTSMALEKPSQPDREARSSGQRSDTLQRLLGAIANLVPSGICDLDAPLADLGIHSVVLIRLIAQCKIDFGVTLKPRDLLKAGTVRRIAQHIEQARPH